VKEKISLNHKIQYNVLVSFVISITLVSPISILPLAYSQEISRTLQWNQEGEGVPRLREPSGIAIDPSSGNVYVADTDSHRIQAFSSNGTFIMEYGEYGEEDGNFRSPEGIAVDQEGNVYVADTENNRIQAFSNGTFLTQWGEYGNNDGEFRSPEGIALDQQGNVYVADTQNSRIQVFSNNGTFLTQWGQYGEEDGNFRSPEGIALDQQGNVYVADTQNSRIQAFSNNGTFLASLGEYGDDDGRFKSPEGIAVDQGGNVYVADTENHRIQMFTSNGTFVASWGEYGRSEEDIEMRSPEGIAVDEQGTIYMTDTLNNRISVIFSGSNNSLPISNTSFSSEEGEIYGNNTRIKIEPVYEGLAFPTAVGFLGPNDMLVLERMNNAIMRIVNGQMLDEPVLDLGNNTKIGSCVCDIAILHNGNNGTSYAFVYYAELNVTEDDGSTKLIDILYRYDIINGKFINPKIIFEMPTVSSALHNGGKLIIGPDKNVYLTTGEIDAWRTKAQNVKNGPLPDGSSAVLRFTPDGEPAVGGGLLGNTAPLDKYYAYGIRNSFGIDYDPFTGNIWITDNGPSFADELNLVKPGFNGGYREIMGFSSLDQSFNLTNLEFFNGTGKYYDPIFEWFESIGVTDLVFVSSDKLGKEYEGNLFVGEINAGYLYRFVLNQTRTGLLLDGSLSDGVANTNLEKLQAVFAKINNGGITDLKVGPDGLIYIVSSNGKIMRLEPMDTIT
jgi:aldose sugar dehydrogenase